MLRCIQLQHANQLEQVKNRIRNLVRVLNCILIFFFKEAINFVLNVIKSEELVQVNKLDIEKRKKFYFQKSKQTYDYT
jgi:hypothetical protein